MVAVQKQDKYGQRHSIPSWTELKKMAQAGYISQVLSEGDLIPIRLTNGEENTIRVTFDGKGKMFFIFENCLKDSMYMAASPKGWFTWASSDIRFYLEQKVYNKLIPEELALAIALTEIPEKLPNGKIEVSDNFLFLPSEGQVFGFSNNRGRPDSQLRCFADRENRRKTFADGVAASWWTRAIKNEGAAVLLVDKPGTRLYANPSDLRGIAPCFCIL